MCVGHLSQVGRDSMRRNGLELCLGWFRLDFRKYFFIERASKPLSRLPRELTESLSLEVCENCAGVVLMDRA